MPEYMTLVRNKAGFVGKRHVLNEGDKRPSIGSEFNYAIVPTDLAEPLKVRKQAARAGWSFILGQPTDKLFDKMDSIWPDGRMSSEQWLPRNRQSKLLSDDPVHRYVIDADGLDLRAMGYDSREDPEATPDYIAQAFDDAGLDWLMTNHIFAPSSSFGLKDPTIVKAHLEFVTDEPFTLAQQKQLTNYVNQCLNKAGYSETSCDTSIYQPYRLLLITKPQVFKRELVNGTYKEYPTKPPYRPEARVVTRGYPRVTDIPGDAWSIERRVHQVTGAPLPHVEYDEVIAPGNVYLAIRTLTMKAAMTTPVAQRDEVREAMRQQIRAEIEALPDTDAKPNRLRHVEYHEFKRIWDGAVRIADERAGLEYGTEWHDGAPTTIDLGAERAALAAYIRKMVKRGMEYSEDAVDPDVMGLAPPRHILVHAPPGFGKSDAFIKAFDTPDLMTKRSGIFTPTDELSNEIMARAAYHHGDEEYTQTRIRHLKGFEKVCYNDKALAAHDQVVELGLSLAGTLCRGCPHSRDCLYPTMHADKSSGLIVAQHAHLPTTVAKLHSADSEGAYDVNIIDESFHTTFLRPRFPQGIAIRKLRSATAVVKGSSFYKTVDLIAYRDDALAALGTANEHGMVPIRSFNAFKRTVKIVREDRTISRPAIQDAINSERALLTDLRQEAAELFEKVAEGIDVKDQLIALTETVRASEMFLEIYNCVNGSIQAERAGHVFGLRIKGARVLAAYRRPLPDAVRQRYMICTDGTANEEVFKAVIGDAVEYERYTVHSMPQHYTLYQYLDRPFGKTKLVQGNPDDPRSTIGVLRNFIRSKAETKKRVLVVAQKSVLEVLVKAGLNSNVSVLNFGALRGIDKYRDYECAIIIGRNMPNMKDLEYLAEALHYDNPDVQDIERSRDFTRVPATFNLRGNELGKSVRIMAESHPDKHVRALVDQIVTAEIQQAVARLRLFDRTEETAAELHVFGQCDTGLSIDHALTFKDAKIEPAHELSICTRSKVLVPMLAERMGMTPNALDSKMKRMECNWPTFKFRVGSKLTKAQIKATSTKEAADILSLLGVEFSELC